MVSFAQIFLITAIINLSILINIILTETNSSNVYAFSWAIGFKNTNDSL